MDSISEHSVYIRNIHIFLQQLQFDCSIASTILLASCDNVQNNWLVACNSKSVIYLSLESWRGDPTTHPTSLPQNYYNPSPLLWKMTSLVHLTETERKEQHSSEYRAQSKVL